MTGAAMLRWAARVLPATACIAAPLLAADAAIERLDGIPPALARCWHPLHEGDEATVRLAFRRDGSVLGEPRITYHRSGGHGEAALSASLAEAVRACTPLRFTPSMGGAIAGRVLSIRLIARPREQRAGLGDHSGDRA